MTLGERTSTKTKAVRTLFGIAVLALLLYIVDVQAVAETFSHLTVGAITLLLLLSIALIYVSAIKWKLFLEALGAKASALHLFNLYLVGYFVNTLLPSYLGGDVVRSIYAGKKTGQYEAFTATILERYTGVVAMVTLGLGAVWIAKQSTLQFKLAVIGLGVALILGTLIALSPRLISLIEKFHLPSKPLRKVQEGLHLARKDPALLAKALLLSFFYHSLTVLNTMAAAYAIGWTDAPPVQLFIVLPLILIIGAIPVAPSGLGIQEGAFTYFLHSVGATAPQALSVALVLRMKSYLLALIGGIVWFRLRAEAPTPSTQAAATIK